MEDNERKQNILISREYVKFDTLRRQAFELGYAHGSEGQAVEYPRLFQADEKAFYLAGFNIARNVSAFNCMALNQQAIIKTLFNFK